MHCFALLLQCLKCRFVAMQWFLDEIKAEPLVDLVGVHSHLGSTITKVRNVSACFDLQSCAAC